MCGGNYPIRSTRGQRDVCRLLDRDASRLSPDELARMRAHFAARIKTTRAQHIDRSYPDLLAEVLDYRRWRTFAFTLIGADGKEEKLTQARHSTLSGGEQSVSLHLPLFAASHVTLSSAHDHCPRLLALDEAFAGVDDNGRRELLGLTAQFDLDLFMTGYDLWATYDTVPACAHYDLSHSATEHMVSALLFVWSSRTAATISQRPWARQGHAGGQDTVSRHCSTRRRTTMTVDPAWDRLLAAARRKLEQTSGHLAGSIGLSKPTSPWNPVLAETMAKHGRAIMEERLIPSLLKDLDQEEVAG